jgi:ferredoxin
VRAIVDRERCFGFGRCAEEVPEVFSQDEEGQSVAGDASGVALERLVDAALGCPRQAIRVIDDDGRDLVDVIGPRP